MTSVERFHLHPRQLPRQTPALVLAFVLATAALSACDTKSDQELIASAKTYLEQKDNKAAIVQLKTALQQNQQSAEARFLLGDTLLKNGDMAAAVVELEKALDLKYSEDEVLPALALALMGSGQAKKVTDLYSRTRLSDVKADANLKAIVAAAFGAQGLIERSEAATNMALQVDPSNFKARLLQARLTAGRGEIDKALELVDAVLAEDPQQREGWHLKGDILSVGKNNREAATVAYREVLKLEPRHMTAHTALMGMALIARDVPAFKAQLDQLKTALPNNPETRFYEAQGALIDNEPARAREITQQLLRIAPDNYRLLQLAGAIEFNGGSLVLAENFLNKAIQVQPRLATARRLLAQTYLRSGQPARALAALQPLLDSNPTAEILALAAESHLQNGQLAQSEVLFTRASQVKPDDPKLRTAVALAQIARGNVDTGLADLETLAATDPGAYADMALISSRLRRNELDNALKAIDRLQSKTPTAALPHHLRGRVQAQRNDFAGARISFDKALAADASYFPAVASLAALDLAQKKPELAIKRFEEQLAREPKNYRALLALAELKSQTGAPHESIRTLLTNAVTANPAEAAPRLLLIDHMLSRNETTAAKAASQDALSALPDNPLLLDALGRSQLAAGEVQQAISTFGKVAVAQPASTQAQLRLAQAHMLNKDPAAARSTLQRALEIDSKSLPALIALVQANIADKRFADALAAARSLQKLRPKLAVGHLLEADAHASQRQWEPTIAALKSALDRQKTAATAIRMHALLNTAGRKPEADRFAASWMREHPRDSGFLFHLGSLAMDEKRYSEAETEYRRVLALTPNDAITLNNLAWLLLQQGKPGALSLAEKANQLSTDQAALMDTLSSALAKEGQLPKAIEWQRKALAKADGAPAYRMRLAKLLIQLGDKTAARAELDTLAKLGDKFTGQDEVGNLLKTL
jgi:putative PEP-CTERM system TPR-repeat lipoprotein